MPDKQKIVSDLKAIVGEKSCLSDFEDLICFSYDAAIEEAMPSCVVCPKDALEIAEIMKWANRERVPIYPRGAGTGLSGGSIPVNGGVVLVTTRLNKILKIDTRDLYAVAETGVITKDLHAKVAELGLMYPPDPSSMKTSTLGGNVAENAGGLRGLKYGVTKDWILALEVVTPQGDIINVGSKCVKSVSGFDLTRLYCGSEGTLGIITKITCKLIPQVEHAESMLAIFDDINKAAETVAAIIANGVIPATLEFMDNVSINAVEDFKNIGLPRHAGAILLIETDGCRESAIKEAEKVIEICKNQGASEVKRAASQAEKLKIWEGRRACLSALARVRPTTILEDATVPRSKIPDMVRAVNEIAAKYSLRIGNFGHAGDGNLHPTILTDLRDKEEMARVEKAIEDIFDAALKLDGTLSGEHGIGSAKKKFLPLEFGEKGVLAMRSIKRALDPNNILNPGKIFMD